MAKHQAVKESEIKTAIQAAQSAIMNRKRPDAQLRRDQGARLMALRGNLEKQLQPLFAKAGLDIATVNKILGGVSKQSGQRFGKGEDEIYQDLCRTEQEFATGNRESKESTGADCVQARDTHTDPVMDGL
jgi:hypothetical protein